MAGKLSPGDRTRLLEDSYLPVHSWSGVAYEGCTAVGIFAYTEPSPICEPGISKDDSRKELTKFLRDQSPNLAVKQAIARLRRASWSPDWGPETIIKAMPDIDSAYFGGFLHHMVQVSGQDEKSFTDLDPGATNLLGLTYVRESDNICCVYLHREEIFNKGRSPKKLMWETIFHELVVSQQRYKALELCLQWLSTPTSVSPAATTLKTRMKPSKAGTLLMGGCSDR